MCNCHSSGGALPHDLTMAAGMLYIMVVMRTGFEQQNFEAKVKEITTNWLSEGMYIHVGIYVTCGSNITLSYNSHLV